MKNYFLFCITLSSLALMPSDKTRSLWAAIRKGPMQGVTKALRAGGSITEKNDYGNNALHIAYSSTLKIKAMFEANREEAQRALTARNNNNQTPHRRALNLNKKKSAHFLANEMRMLKEWKATLAALKKQRPTKKAAPKKKKRQQFATTTRKKTKVEDPAEATTALTKPTQAPSSKKITIDRESTIQALMNLQRLRW
jgi:hypothetical protein